MLNEKDLSELERIGDPVILEEDLVNDALTAEVREASPIMPPKMDLAMQPMETSPLPFNEVEHLDRATPEGRQHLLEISDQFHDELGALQVDMDSFGKINKRLPNGGRITVSHFRGDIEIAKFNQNGSLAVMTSFSDRAIGKERKDSSGTSTSDSVHDWRIDVRGLNGVGKGTFSLEERSFYEIGTLPKSSGDIDALTTVKNLVSEIKLANTQTLQ